MVYHVVYLVICIYIYTIGLWHGRMFVQDGLEDEGSGGLEQVLRYVDHSLKCRGPTVQKADLRICRTL